VTLAATRAGHRRPRRRAQAASSGCLGVTWMVALISFRVVMRLEKLHLDCASSAPSHHGSTQQCPLLHGKLEIVCRDLRRLRLDDPGPAIISPSRRLLPIIATSPEPMATARLEQMVTLIPRRLAEQTLRAAAAAPSGPAAASESGTVTVTGPGPPAASSQALRVRLAAAHWQTGPPSLVSRPGSRSAAPSLTPSPSHGRASDSEPRRLLASGWRPHSRDGNTLELEIAHATQVPLRL
jgi:hypothetical protein